MTARDCGVGCSNRRRRSYAPPGPIDSANRFPQVEPTLSSVSRSSYGCACGNRHASAEPDNRAASLSKFPELGIHSDVDIARADAVSVGEVDDIPRRGPFSGVAAGLGAALMSRCSSPSATLLRRPTPRRSQSTIGQKARSGRCRENSRAQLGAYPPICSAGQHQASGFLFRIVAVVRIDESYTPTCYATLCIEAIEDDPGARP